MRRFGPRVGAVMAGAVAVGSAACIGPQAFPCQEDSQCVLDGVEGQCMEPGFCAYPDDDCDSGRRFESNADEVAGECVEEETVACVPLTSVSAGQDHTCALDADGGVWCWGSNTLGALGSAITNFMVDPVRVEGIPPIQSLSTSGHTCALDFDGGLWCWGDNQFGQVNWDAQTPRIEEPRRLPLDEVAVEAFTTGVTATCASSGTDLVCWGTVFEQRVAPTIITGLDDPLVQMVGGEGHACGRTTDGRVMCWGDDSEGQLGDAGGTGVGTAVEVVFLEEGTVVDLAADGQHTCALLENVSGRSVYCWGSNTFGQTGLLIDMPITQPHTAVGSFIGGDFISIAAGSRHACVLSGAGELFCWGNNEKGQGSFDADTDWVSGPNAVPLPMPVPDEASLAPLAVSAGAEHTCVLREGGVVDCWGCNEQGQLGTEPRTCDGSDVVVSRVCPQL